MEIKPIRRNDPILEQLFQGFSTETLYSPGFQLIHYPRKPRRFPSKFQESEREKGGTHTGFGTCLKSSFRKKTKRRDAVETGGYKIRTEFYIVAVISILFSVMFSKNVCKKILEYVTYQKAQFLAPHLTLKLTFYISFYLPFVRTICIYHSYIPFLMYHFSNWRNPARPRSKINPVFRISKLSSSYN